MRYKPPSAFNNAQKRWLMDRVLEGYAYTELSKFTGVSSATVRRVVTDQPDFDRKNIRASDDLPYLIGRKKEFLALADIPDNEPPKQRARYTY